MTPGWMLFSYPKSGDSVRILDLLDVTEKIDLNLRHQVWSLNVTYFRAWPNQNHRNISRSAGIEA